jgi:sec-independent protein translocase protein TatC
MAKFLSAPQLDPDDPFSDTKMSFGDHIEDLRAHLLRAVYGFLVAMVFGLIVGKWVLQFIAAPVEYQLKEYYERFYQAKQENYLRDISQARIAPILLEMWEDDRESPDEKATMRKHLNEMRAKLDLPPIPDPPDADEGRLQRPLMGGIMRMLDRLEVGDWVEPAVLNQMTWARRKVMISNPEQFVISVMADYRKIVPPTLKTLNVQEAFMAYFKVSMVTGLVIGSPWIFLQIWLFIAAGLYPHEKKLVHMYLPISLFLFFIGVLVCEFAVLPKAIEALLWFNEWIGFEPDLRFSEWLGFAIFMPVVFGLAFQTPLAMYFLFRIGIFDVNTYREKRKLAWFLMGIFAAVATPSVDAMGMLFLLIPMCVLYEFGIWLCQFQPKPVFEEDEEPLDELIGV